MARTLANTVEGASVADFETLLSVRVKKMADILGAAARQLRLETRGVRFAEIRILAYLSNRVDSSVLEISRDLSVDKAWISRLLRTLGHKQLIVRCEQGDGRPVLINLTAAGRETYETVLAHILQHEGTLTNSIDHEGAARLFDQLEVNLRGWTPQLGVAAPPSD